MFDNPAGDWYNCAREETGRKEKAYPGGAESLSGCEPPSSSRCDVLNDVRPLAESKGLIEIPGAAEDKTTRSGGVGVNPSGMSPLVVMACDVQTSHHPGFWSQGTNLDLPPRNDLHNERAL
jgi:hypothetical protein